MRGVGKASVIAPANIALVKYWGKRNKEEMLPFNSSISMTTGGMSAHTTVDFDSKLESDSLILNNKEYTEGSDEFDDYIARFLSWVRAKYGKTARVRIKSENNFPTAAGLASSAAGFGALALAVKEALSLNITNKEVSVIARHGSGSATRSIHGGFVKWHKGERDDGSDSYAEQIRDENYWSEFRMIVCVTSRKEKKVKSRAGMSQTVLTSPMYKAWLETIEDDLSSIETGIVNKDFTQVGTIAERNCLKMHATMSTTVPAIIYWNPATVSIIHAVMNWREEGLESYFTIDGGPQVKILCLENDVPGLITKLKRVQGIEKMFIIKPGKGASITTQHLF